MKIEYWCTQLGAWSQAEANKLNSFTEAQATPAPRPSHLFDDLDLGERYEEFDLLSVVLKAVTDDVLLQEVHQILHRALLENLLLAQQNNSNQNVHKCLRALR